MNSSKRGLASGFRLQSLDLVSLKYRVLGGTGVTGGLLGVTGGYCDVTEEFVSGSSC